MELHLQNQDVLLAVSGLAVSGGWSEKSSGLSGSGRTGFLQTITITISDHLLVVDTPMFLKTVV